MSRAVALALVLSLASCATYEGSRDTATASGATFGLGMATWIAGQQADNEATAVTGLAVSTASMMILMASSVGMVVLPRRVEIALRIAHELVVRAEDGDCETVVQRRREVQELDELVYQVVLMEDPAVAGCFEPSSSSSSSPPADRVLLAPASTSTVR